MRYRPVPAPSLWRTTVVVLILGLLANIFLWRLVRDDDAFAKVIAVASGVAAIGLVLHRFVWARFIDEALMLSFAVWMANLIEFVTETNARWESQFRQGGFYLAFAILSLGAYVAVRKNP